eukprot:1161044-Pelagomonas_calceolata.AAC.4
MRAAVRHNGSGVAAARAGWACVPLTKLNWSSILLLSHDLHMLGTQHLKGKALFACLERSHTHTHTWMQIPAMTGHAHGHYYHLMRAL